LGGTRNFVHVNHFLDFLTGFNNTLETLYNNINIITINFNLMRMYKKKFKTLKLQRNNAVALKHFKFNNKT